MTLNLFFLFSMIHLLTICFLVQACLAIPANMTFITEHSELLTFLQDCMGAGLADYVITNPSINTTYIYPKENRTSQPEGKDSDMMNCLLQVFYPYNVVGLVSNPQALPLSSESSSDCSSQHKYEFVSTDKRKRVDSEGCAFIDSPQNHGQDVHFASGDHIGKKTSLGERCSSLYARIRKISRDFLKSLT